MGVPGFLLPLTILLEFANHSILTRIIALQLISGLDFEGELRIMLALGACKFLRLALQLGYTACNLLGLIVAPSGKLLQVSDAAHRESLLRELPIEDIWGVGWRMAPKLRDKGISTAWQLISATDAWLRQQFTITGMRMIDELRGEARIPFGDKHATRKSIMRSRSFGHRVRDYHQLESAIATFAAQAAARLRSQDSVARHIAVFLSANRHTEGQTRVYLETLVTLDEPSADTARIIAAALTGLEQIYDDQFAYQKAGVTLVGIMPREAWQLSMFSDETRRDERTSLMASIDQLNKRYGHVIFHASEKLTDDSWRSKHELRSPRYTTSWADVPRLCA